MDIGGAFVKPQFQEFVRAAMDGTLPAPPQSAEMPPEVRALAEELSVIHLPEWETPSGRKVAEPTVMSIKGAYRVAEYLLKRGVSFDPEQASVRWMPTPGAHLGVGDPGKHIFRNEDGTWPEDPDAEEFWSMDDIKCTQLPNGRWAAVHPRGIQCEDASKSEAFAMCVERVRAKLAELKGNS